jgi:hypothetical protein
MVLANNPPNISFRRNLVGPKLIAWLNLIDRLANVKLRDIPDVFKWNLHQSRIFSVPSIYNALINIDIIPNNPYMEDKYFIKNKDLSLVLVYGGNTYQR